MPDTRNHYEVLGVSRCAGTEEIKKAYQSKRKEAAAALKECLRDARGAVDRERDQKKPVEATERCSRQRPPRSAGYSRASATPSRRRRSPEQPARGGVKPAVVGSAKGPKRTPDVAPKAPKRTSDADSKARSPLRPEVILSLVKQSAEEECARGADESPCKEAQLSHPYPEAAPEVEEEQRGICHDQVLAAPKALAETQQMGADTSQDVYETHVRHAFGSSVPSTRDSHRSDHMSSYQSARSYAPSVDAASSARAEAAATTSPTRLPLRTSPMASLHTAGAHTVNLSGSPSVSWGWRCPGRTSPQSQRLSQVQADSRAKIASPSGAIQVATPSRCRAENCPAKAAKIPMSPSLGSRTLRTPQVQNRTVTSPIRSPIRQVKVSASPPKVNRSPARAHAARTAAGVASLERQSSPSSSRMGPTMINASPPPRVKVAAPSEFSAASQRVSSVPRNVTRSPASTPPPEARMAGPSIRRYGSFTPGLPTTGLSSPEVPPSVPPATSRDGPMSAPRSWVWSHGQESLPVVAASYCASGSAGSPPPARPLTAPLSNAATYPQAGQHPLVPQRMSSIGSISCGQMSPGRPEGPPQSCARPGIAISSVGDLRSRVPHESVNLHDPSEVYGSSISNLAGGVVSTDDPRMAAMLKVHQPVPGATAGATEPSVNDYINYGRSFMNDLLSFRSASVA